jgi:hypothetical protein
VQLLSFIVAGSIFLLFLIFTSNSSKDFLQAGILALTLTPFWWYFLRHVIISFDGELLYVKRFWGKEEAILLTAIISIKRSGFTDETSTGSSYKIVYQEHSGVKRIRYFYIPAQNGPLWYRVKEEMLKNNATVVIKE